MELKRQLGLVQVVCIASGAMISSGLFILPGLAYARTGPSVILCYLLAGVLSLPGMLSLAEMTTAMPKAGGDAYTIMRSMGPGIGSVAGLLSWFSLSMKSAFALLGMSLFTVILLNVDVHLVAVVCCLVFLCINLIGVREAGWTQTAMVAGLFALMALYVVLSLPLVQVGRFEPFAPKGFAAVFFVTGYVFVSYGGLLKVASVAEEIRNPSRNIPMGMLVSLLVVSAFYTLVVFVTVGLLDGAKLSGSLTPVSDAAAVSMGTAGRLALSVAAVLAFLSTANAGMMTAARSLVPLSRDRLFPNLFGKINARFGTPHNALLLTAGFIVVSLFVKLEILVEAASLVLILTNVLSCLSVIILRESGLQNYRPRFRAPLYPWMQIAGLAAFGFVLVEMGIEAYLVSAGLVLAGFCSYWFFGRRRVRQESALLYLIERVTARELVTGTLEAELKQIIRERDQIVADRFDGIIEKCVALDLEEPLDAEEVFRRVAAQLSPRLQVGRRELFEALKRREAEGSTALDAHLAIPHLIVEGKGLFEVVLVRSRGGIMFSADAPRVQAVFVLAGTPDERNFHLNALAAIAQIVRDETFMAQWLKARGPQALRDLILLGHRKRMYA